MFPPPYDLLPRLCDLPVNPAVVASFHNAAQISKTWRETFPEQSLIPGILDDLVIVTAHLTAESIRTEGASWSDSIGTGLLVNPLVYQLYELRVGELRHGSRGEVLQEVFRIAALLFLRRTKWHAVFVSSLIDSQVVKLKHLLCTTNEYYWTGFETLKAWILVMGALYTRSHSAERLWYETEILRELGCMEGVGLPDLLAQVKGILWFEDLFAEFELTLRKELRMLS